MLTNKMLTALYCRVACADELALETQRISLRGYAKTLGHADCAEYLDNGASGLTLDRPAFSMLEADIRAARIQTVIVRDISRISRSAFVVHRWMQNAQAHGVTVISQRESTLDEVMRVHFALI